MRRPFLIAVAAVAALAGQPAASAGAVAEADSSQARAKLRWRACERGFQCASLRVPRDWTKPRGRRIKLALIRMRAARGRRTGSLLINPGGPGGSGLAYVRTDGPQLRKATRGRLDIVSWDPRGLGESTPIRCPEGNDQFFNADPATAAGLAAMGAAVQERARACFRRYGDYLALLGTNQVVQDMDAIRAALGERRVNYLGLSYGTRIGAVYAQRYPRRVRTMVLDGSLPPVSTLLEIAEGNGIEFEATLHAWLADCARRPPCAFGDEPLAGYDELLARIRSDPPIVASAGNRRLTPGLLYQVMLAAVTNLGFTGTVEEAIRAFRVGGDPGPLMQLAELIIRREPDGSYSSNAQEVFQFVNCLDWQDRPTPEQVAAHVRQASAWSPRLGPFAMSAFAFMNNAGCPVDARPVPPVSATGVPPVLVIGNTTDPETVLGWSQELSESLPGSRLLVAQRWGHTAINSSACVRRLAASYLLGRRLPPEGTVCSSPGVAR